MKAAKFANYEAAAEVLAKTGRTWTTVKVSGGVKVRALMPWGWALVSEIDVHHMNNGVYNV